MSDLDARVAALKVCPFCGREPKLLDLAGWEVQCDCGVNMCLASPEQAAVIKAWNQRAELQKPALHEPIDVEEAANSIQRDLCELEPYNPAAVDAVCVDLVSLQLILQRNLESFLQDRAKPAQAEIAPLTNTPWFGCGECDVSFKCSGGKSGCIRASKGEKT